MGKGGFKELKVWQKSKDLAVSVYQLTCSEPFNKDYGLRDQIRRAAVSIPSNIAEGDERETDKEAVRYFYFAKGSSAELLTQAIIAFEIGYIDSTTFNDIEMKCLETSRMLSKLIAAKSNKNEQKV
jgi:four helix bundle protein